MVLLLVIYLALLPALAAANPHWTEHDENERISAIIAAEKRAFDEEMKAGSQSRYRSSGGRDYGASSSNDLPDYQDLYEKRYRMDRQRQRGRQPAAATTAAATTTTTTTEQPSYEALSSSEEATRRGDNWCYLCASPLGSLSSNSRKAVEQFLEIRRTTFPKDAVTRECIAPRNFTALRRQECKHKFCQTLVLMDHEEGSSFVMRGCAEHFGAIHKELLEAREDNTCVRLHDKLDIRECICRDRKSCYAGRTRSPAALPYSSTTTVILTLLIATYRLIA